MNFNFAALVFGISMVMCGGVRSADQWNPEDIDHDGMPDEWEIFYFGGLQEDALGDRDHDGVSNLAEFQAGTDPMDPNSRPK